MDDTANTITKDDIAIIIRVFNEQKNIESIIEKILPYSNNVIVIDDGSSDETCNVIKKYPVTILRNLYHCGNDASLLRGFSYAKNKKVKAVMTLTPNEKLNALDFSKFLKTLQENPKSIIIGKKTLHENNQKNKNNITNFLLSIGTGEKITKDISECRLYPIELLEKTLVHYSRKKNNLLENYLLIDGRSLGYQTKIIEMSPRSEITPNKAAKSTFIDRTKIAAELGWKVFSHGLKFNNKKK